MSTAPIQTQHGATSRSESRQEALSGVEFAQQEVARAEKRLADVERDFRDRLDAAQSWLSETQRRLRCAMMIQRRLDPEVRGEAIPPAPWLPDATPTLLNWRDRTTVDERVLREDD
jgi:hypothetical protein